jgi:hypothetical protein
VLHQRVPSEYNVVHVPLLSNHVQGR